MFVLKVFLAGSALARNIDIGWCCLSSILTVLCFVFVNI